MGVRFMAGTRGVELVCVYVCVGGFDFRCAEGVVNGVMILTWQNLYLARPALCPRKARSYRRVSQN